MSKRLSMLFLALLALPCHAQKKSGPMAPIKDDPALPRVLLIGDSISIGYTLSARAELKGVANLHRIPTNGGPTSRGLENIEKWIGQTKWGVIHFNWGLHDLCYRDPKSKTQGNRDKVNGKVTHDLVAKLKATGAKLIFATTTPVPEGEAGRKVGDDLRYNKAAVAVMKRHKVVINDLHAAVAGKMETLGTRPGNVHFKPEGSKLLGQKVAAGIKEALGKSSK